MLTRYYLLAIAGLLNFAMTEGGANAEIRLIETGQLRDGAAVYLKCEPADNGSITLDANNGFFDKGCFNAQGKRAAPDSVEQKLIHFHYDYLTVREAKSTGTAHWYLWVSEPGDVAVDAHLQVPKADQGIDWAIQIGDQESTVTAKASDHATPQDWNLSFSVKQRGLHTISIRKLSPRAVSTQIHRLTVTGSAIAGASLVRARWRPAAIHTQYSSSTCPASRIWVMETENISDYDSYSPITTPFGYFGGSLSGNRRAVGNMNFSMWAAGGNAKTAPPLSEMPHLLAVGHPKAEFGGFGHEGSGVKVRNWEPLAHHPKSIIQALRMDVVDGQATYSGYLFDDRVNQWRLYAVGRRPLAKQKRRNVRSPNQDNLRIASFCEIPGPASNERTGDRQRTIRRRGWVMDADGGWHAIDRQTRSVKPNAGPVNQAIAAGKSGWFHMSTGGVEMLDSRQAEVRLPKASPKLPAYLQKDVAAKLFQYPADIGQSSVTSLTSTSATVSYTLASVGDDAQAVLYYGPQDCLSFVARKDFHATERKGVIDQVFSKERTWQASTQAMSVANGENSFSLTGLKPNNTYFYRLLLTNRDGKIWSFDAGHFQSAKE